MDFLFRMRRKVSIVAFNNALPSNFKLLHLIDVSVFEDPPDMQWRPVPGVHIDEIDNFELILPTPTIPATLSPELHVNFRVTPAWSGWDGLFIEEGDPDYDDGTGTGDPRLDNSKLKRWFFNNGGERLDDAAEHPRSGRSDMRWWRWTDGTEWVDVTIDTPQLRRRVWL